MKSMSAIHEGMISRPVYLCHLVLSLGERSGQLSKSNDIEEWPMLELSPFLSKCILHALMVILAQRVFDSPKPSP